VSPVSAKYLEEHPEVALQNVALLKNAMELWRTALSTSDAISPILYHYSWHCFNSFFAYTFFQWDAPHSRSHGIQVKLSDNLDETKIKITGDGLFQRLVDTLSLIGVSLAFSPALPIVKKGELTFGPNEGYILKRSQEILLSDLLSFNAIEFEKGLYESHKEEMVHCPFLINSIYLPNQALKSYLVLFVASSIARYRPVLWHSILVGATPNEASLALHSANALLDYAIGSSMQGDGFLEQVARIVREMRGSGFRFIDNSRRPANVDATV
jgi:hypothetical protein